MQSHKESKDRNCERPLEPTEVESALVAEYGISPCTGCGDGFGFRDSCPFWFVHPASSECVPGPGDAGDRALNETGLGWGEEEGVLRSSPLKTGGNELKELDAHIRAIEPSAKECDTNRNSSKWSGLMTGLTF